VEFIDVYAGGQDPEKVAVADWLGIKIAPGHHSLLVSNDHKKVRAARKGVDFVAGIPSGRAQLNQMLTDTHYDFFIVHPDLRLSKRIVRMAKRYETALAVPLAPVFSLKQKLLRRTRRNVLLVQDLGGTLLLCSGAGSPAEIRSGRDLAAIGVLLGLKPDYARKAVSRFPAQILKRNEGRRKQEVWGVEVLE